MRLTTLMTAITASMVFFACGEANIAEESVGGAGGAPSSGGAAGISTGGTAGKTDQVGGSGAAAGAGGQAGTPCGGRAGNTCSTEEYCDFELNGCGFDDGQGVCKPRPDECSGVGCAYELCGCDGQRYCNECVAAQAGVDVTSLDICAEPKLCGGQAGLECDPDEWCDFPSGSFCGGDDTQGVCLPRPDACPDIACSDVCGCDGQIYCTPCHASAAGVDLADDPEACGELKPCNDYGGPRCDPDEYCDFELHGCGFDDSQGVCRPRPNDCTGIGCSYDLCGCDGQHYCNECEAARAGVDVTSQDICGEAKLCGGQAGLECGPDEWCDFPSDSFCGGDDTQGVCRPRPTECQGVGCTDQLCGCDGRYYCNECLAAMAGVDVSTSCPEPQGCGGRLGNTCNPDEFCDYDNDMCGADDSPGLCKVRPTSCPGDCPGVCDCGQQFFCNACQAAESGSDVNARMTECAD